MSIPNGPHAPAVNRHIPELDGIRGAAILAVMALHFVGVIHSTNLAEHVLIRLCAYGVWGVDLFFVLSGFLITGILYDSRGGKGYFRNFYARRSLRIFPLYYAVLVVFLVLPLIGAGEIVPQLQQVQDVQIWLWTYLANFYLPTTGGFSIPYISHFWSLAVEEQFYLVWPWVIGCIPRKSAMRLSLLLVFLAPAFRLGVHIFGFAELHTYMFLPCRLDTLCLGAWLALAIRDPAMAPQVLRLARRMVAIGLAIVMGCALWPAANDHRFILLTLQGTALAAICGGVISLAAHVEGPRMLKAALRMAWLRWLGKYSYGLYVYHGIVGWYWHHVGMLEFFTTQLGSRWLGIAASASLGSALSIALAVVSYDFFEVRFLKLKRLFLTASA